MHVKHKVTDWIPLNSIPSQGSYVDLALRSVNFWKDLISEEWVNNSRAGVYQVSITKPKQLVHKDICYIGESDCLPKRLSDLRSAAVVGNKVAHHMCGVYIREEGIDTNTVYVRCIIPDNKDDKLFIERWLHSEHESIFGYRVGYAWEEASAGYKSSRIQVQMAIKRLESLEACFKVQEVLNQQINKLQLLEEEDAKYRNN